MNIRAIGTAHGAFVGLGCAYFDFSLGGIGKGVVIGVVTTFVARVGAAYLEQQDEDTKPTGAPGQRQLEAPIDMSAFEQDLQKTTDFKPSNLSEEGMS